MPECENKYIIKKNDIILNDVTNSTNIMLYIDPDLYFMELCRENGYKLICFLHNSYYDNIPFFCNVSETVDAQWFIVLELEDIKPKNEDKIYASFYKNDNLLKKKNVDDSEIIENFVHDMLSYETDDCGSRTLIWNMRSVLVIFIFSILIFISIIIFGYICYKINSDIERHEAR
jgi:hypothetical protein